MEADSRCLDFLNHEVHVVQQSWRSPEHFGWSSCSPPSEASCSTTGSTPPAGQRQVTPEPSRSELGCALVVPDDLRSAFSQFKGGAWWAARDSNPEPMD